MSPARQYRNLAAQLRAKAQGEEDRQVRAEWEHLARCYIRLAEEAERNGRTGLDYDPLLPAYFGGFKGKPA